jgi:uncharacterized protein YjbI with pentapeptide repeats
MANPEHIKLLSAGAGAVNRWTAQHPSEALDCSGGSFQGINLVGYAVPRINFSGADLRNADLREANLEGANLSGATLRNAIAVKTNLSTANLSGADCKEASFEHAVLNKADLADTDFWRSNLASASLTDTNLKKAKFNATRLREVSLENFDLEGCDLTNVDLQRSNLSGANLTETKLVQAVLAYANLSSAVLDKATLDRAVLDNANLKSASLRGASLRGANASDADLTEARCDYADFYECVVDNTNFDKGDGLAFAKNLQSVRLLQANDVKNFDTVIVPLLEKWIGWEHIRWLGRLPLFGASYAALIAIPFLYYLLDLFNRRIDALRAWAAVEVDRDGLYGVGAKVILDHLHREPIPGLSLLLLLSTLLLGIGATIFTLACPPRIREFNRDQWRDQLGHSLIHYLPLSWQHRWTRVTCLVLYLVGGGGVTWVLLNKLWNVFWFIVENT